jgi:hypothetical protein
MKKLGLSVLILTCLCLTACDDSLEGSLSNTSELSIKDKKGNLQVIAPGSRATKMEVGDGGKKLEIKFKDAAGKKQEIKMSVPQGSIPSHSGSIDLRGATIGQSFDLAGNVDTRVDASPSTQGTESCTIYTTEYVCHDVEVTDENGNKHTELRCGNEEVAHSGNRQVMSHSETTTVSASVQFLDSQTRLAIGQFNGSNSQSQTIQDYAGPCEMGWGL